MIFIFLKFGHRSLISYYVFRNQQNDLNKSQNKSYVPYTHGRHLGEKMFQNQTNNSKTRLAANFNQNGSNQPTNNSQLQNNSSNTNSVSNANSQLNHPKLRLDLKRDSLLSAIERSGNSNTINSDDPSVVKKIQILRKNVRRK